VWNELDLAKFRVSFILAFLGNEGLGSEIWSLTKFAWKRRRKQWLLHEFLHGIWLLVIAEMDACILVSLSLVSSGLAYEMREDLAVCF